MELKQVTATTLQVQGDQMRFRNGTQTGPETTTKHRNNGTLS